MKIMVTGGSGFIGTNFIIEQLEHTDNVVLNYDKLTYASNTQYGEELLSLKYRDNERYSFIKGDITNGELLKETLEEFQPDAIVNFAAESHVDNSIEKPDEFIQTNIVGSFRILQAALTYWENEGKPEHFRFHHVSTDEVYGALGESGTFVESTPYDPRSPYSASKSASDHLVKAYFHTYGLPVVITNCSNNYGPYQHREKLIPKIITNALNGDKIPVYGKGENIRDWLYVTDHCDAIYAVLTKGRVGETYNIGGNHEMRNIDIVEYILEELGQSSTDLIEYVEDRKGHDFRYAIDFSKLTNELGWTPKETFKSGIRKTISWYQKNFLYK
tara:strand:- start:2447 stop:3436 length:990 start_codon:yes stop_codon:yes gene_type:complete